MSKNKLVTPFLKWVGGKRQLMPEIKALLPKQYSTYYEPFVGGGAVLFSVQPKKAVINDFNEELINTYQVIKNSPHELIKNLAKHLNEPDYFYQIRELDRSSDFKRLTDIERASRLIYLNKTCYNGLYRVNQAGEFNTPFGRYKNPNIVNQITIEAVSNYLNQNQVSIVHGDFEDSLRNIRKGAFVYFDPPYDPISKSSNFTGYVQGGFDGFEQERLKALCDKLHDRGVKFMLSNSSTPLIKSLYKDYQINTVKANRTINAVASSRGAVDEVLVRNYE